jgi:hypothetical protein
MRRTWYIISTICLCLALCGFKISCTTSDTSQEFQFKGKQYVLAGLQGAGYTREHRSPVYTLVVMAKEDTKKWTKK